MSPSLAGTGNEPMPGPTCLQMPSSTWLLVGARLIEIPPTLGLNWCHSTSDRCSSWLGPPGSPTPWENLSSLRRAAVVIIIAIVAGIGIGLRTEPLLIGHLAMEIGWPAAAALPTASLRSALEEDARALSAEVAALDEEV